MFEREADLLTIKRLSELLSINVKTAQRMCRDGELPAVRLGSRWYVARDALVEFVEKKAPGLATTCPGAALEDAHGSSIAEGAL